MRALGISLISLTLTGLVIGNAYYQKKQFYPSVVYITKSNPSMAVIYIQSLVLVLMLGKLMKKVFLGTLRAAEFEHLMERFWYALTETCLAFTVFRDDFNPKFVALFTVLLFLKSFHWLAEDRVDYMERSPVIGWIFHLRVAGLLACLGLFDYQLISYAYHSTLTKGATVQLVFGFEYAILMTMVLNTAIKYMFHAAELRSDTPWENKAVFLLYTELIVGFIRVVLYVIFVILMVKIYTLPLFAFRPMYYTMRNFKKALNDVILSRRAIRNMNTLYPDATQEELQLSDNICIICREDMVSSSKKLPCGHIFHTACLRSWFQRQQTCPTCRLNILRTPITTVVPNLNQPNVNEAVNAANVANEGNRSISTVGINTTTAQSNVPILNMQNPTAVPLIPGAPIVLPHIPLMGMPTYTMPLPPAPPALETLTEEELRAMEGNERQHLEERIKHLHNIHTLLHASVVLMNQYTAMVARLPPLNVPSGSSPRSDLGSTSAIATSLAGPHSSAGGSNTSVQSTSQPAGQADALLEDLGSDDDTNLTKEPLPSTSKEFLITPDQGESAAKSTENVSDNSNIRHADSSEMSEIRRRRLEKFGSRTGTD
ncbi:E3 ubiquitin-protein ligase HRD1 [Toxorhynchites rutilus septentrionalis]|uniref:E3 ubiquitin-protein ligase HRD1 n=1 Tax=Toxorhynchites rutilus septentrionalis TaxID=329112 RepID=UPI002479E0E7|nr:E3 ubiquitin-protein ligase HRD1 [Toxorhynchites rutilus septentrionalis]XP_055615916.1 E3 ubiquitin-protein ligase HRD1 [Toxorhynchites rutilus septentrionalis]